MHAFRSSVVGLGRRNPAFSLSSSLAPTGSGKTVLFELSIIRILEVARETGKSLKCVYMAPTKVSLVFMVIYRWTDYSTGPVL
jgi:hypothetical protein